MVSQKQIEGAINHYIEAGATIKALDASIQSKQWKKAIGIVDSIAGSDKVKEYYIKLAEHFDSAGDTMNAEKYYVDAGIPQEAVKMYIKGQKWERAYKLSLTYMPKESASNWFTNLAKDMEKKGLSQLIQES